MWLRCVLAAVMLSLTAGAAQVRAQDGDSDRHVGYYYPVPQTSETYNARAQTLQESDRSLRIGFVTGLTNQMIGRPYAPTMAVFAKGAEAQKLVIVALQDGHINTLYRARAVFAQLTAVARVMPIFKELGVQEWFTFFDLLKLMGFQQVTISNGHEFAHQVTID